MTSEAPKTHEAETEFVRPSDPTLKHQDDARRQGFLFRMGMKMATPFIWVGSMIAQWMTVIAVTIVALIACVILYAMYAPTVSNTVQFEHGKVDEKGWFANWLWRSDQSKIFQITTTADNTAFLGGDVQSFKVHALRANGEVTASDGDGHWKILREAQ